MGEFVPQKKDNPLFELIFTIALPSLVLLKLSKPEFLGESNAFFAALVFPLGYMIWKYIQTREFNLISLMGLISVLASGGLFFLKANVLGFAFKEALMPSILGFLLLFSKKKEDGLLAKLIYNENIFNKQKIQGKLEEENKMEQFGHLLTRTTWLAVSSFGLSAILNFSLAFYFLKSPVGTQEFNSEMGEMNLWSWPMIVVPSMALNLAAIWVLIRGLKALTGFTVEEIMAPKA
jgi:hypothetical protein